MLGKTKLYLTTLAVFALYADHAFAGFLRYTPPPTPVPELDGPGALAALALLASVVAVLFNRSRAR